jgi:hypothetical protein
LYNRSLGYCTANSASDSSKTVLQEEQPSNDAAGNTTDEAVTAAAADRRIITLDLMFVSSLRRVWSDSGEVSHSCLPF